MILAWAYLAGAIVAECVGTLALRAATTGRSWWYVLVAAGYVTAFGMLSSALTHGLGLGVAYGVWAAVGVALTAVFGRVLFGEPLTRKMALGIAVIAAGVLMIELGSR